MSKIEKVQIREIDERWNEQMLSIVRHSPIESNGLKIIFDRHPNIFLILRLKSEKLRCIGFFQGEKLVGFAIMLYRKILVNGTPQSVRYFGYLAVDPSSRGMGFLFKMSDFFFGDSSEKIGFGYTVIMQGNRTATRLLNRFNPKYPDMPHSKKIGNWHVHNILLTFRVRRRSPYKIRPAQLSDIESIVRLLQDEYKKRLFGPIVTRKRILYYLNELPEFEIGNYYIAESEQEIVGVCCAWDMSPVKKNRVISYSPKLKRIRFLVNTFARFFHYPGLPAEGKAFRDVTITDFAVKNRDPNILKALLNEVYNDYRRRNYHMMIFGCHSKDPLIEAVRHYFSRSVISQIHIFSRSRHIIDQFNGDTLPLIDMTLL